MQPMTVFILLSLLNYLLSQNNILQKQLEDAQQEIVVIGLEQVSSSPSLLILFSFHIQHQNRCY